jgi:hypothetical protein
LYENGVLTKLSSFTLAIVVNILKLLVKVNKKFRKGTFERDWNVLNAGPGGE